MKLRTPVGTRHFLCPVCQGPLSECWSSESAVIDYEGGAQKVALAAILRAEQLQARIDELTARNAKLEAVAEDVEKLRNVYNADGDGLRWDIAYAAGALFRSLDALDD